MIIDDHNAENRAFEHDDYYANPDDDQFSQLRECKICYYDHNPGDNR